MFREHRKLIIIFFVVLAIALLVYLAIKLVQREKEGEEPLDDERFLENRIKNKPVLSPAKEELKRDLTEPLGGPGTLYETTDIRIDWLPSVNLFQVEIKTIDIFTAKGVAIDWFKTKGFAEEDICALPVMFYLNWEVAQELEGSGLIFDPLPDFCQY